MLERFLASGAGRFASRWAFVLPVMAFLGMVARSTGGCGHVTSRAQYALPYLVCCCAAGVWHSLSRRDVADRLGYWALILTIHYVIDAIRPVRHCAAADLSWTSAVLGIFSGVVVTELWLRYREKRTMSRRPFTEDELRELRR